jgi:hypothetical protein
MAHLHGECVSEEQQVSTAAAHAAPFDHVEVADRLDQALSGVLRGREIRRHRRTESEACRKRVELECEIGVRAMKNPRRY